MVMTTQRGNERLRTKEEKGDRERKTLAGPETLPAPVSDPDIGLGVAVGS